jgi:tetratricopeptide (TPR) repeat protein
MRRFSLFFALCLAVLSVRSQTSGRNDQLKLDADYFLMRNEYDKALDVYLDILRSEPDNADIKHRIGICYLNSEDDKANAIPFLEEACEKVSLKYNIKSLKETNAPIEAFFMLGSAYRVNNQPDKAISAYEKFKELLDPRDSYTRDVTDQYINSCHRAIELQLKPVNVQVSNLGNLINNHQPNFNAVVSEDGTTLVYTTRGRLGYEIYSSAYKDNQWTEPKNITNILGAGKYMKTSAISPDGKKLLLIEEKPTDNDIYESVYTKTWSKVAKLKAPVYSNMNETHASFSPDGNTLYFTSDRKGGEGDIDIYKSELQGEKWGKPQNLGPGINTPYNEETPFVTADGNVLYFSSEGHDGMGGYDIFRYDFRHPEAGAVNIGFPLNTTDNNTFYVPLDTGEMAYYAMVRDDTHGARDIYKVMVLPPEEEIATAPETPYADSDTFRATAAINAVPDLVITEPGGSIAVQEEESAGTDPGLSDPRPEAEISGTTNELSVPGLPVQESHGLPEEIRGEARSYAVQFMALRNMVDPSYFKDFHDISVNFGQEDWYRYTWLVTTDSLEAEKIKNQMVDRGFTDSFIRRRGFIPRYTIQVMAVPGPVVSLEQFSNLSDITAIRDRDTFCRYTTGEFRTKEEARAVLPQVRNLGYSGAFVRKVKMVRE